MAAPVMDTSGSHGRNHGFAKESICNNGETTMALVRIEMYYPLVVGLPTVASMAHRNRLHCTINMIIYLKLSKF